MNGALYKCNNCGHVFEHPKILLGYDPLFPRDSDCPNEHVCPQCESDDYDPADVCAECNETVYEKDMLYGLCKRCVEKAAKEKAADYVLHSSEVLDNFAWWLHTMQKD